LCQEHQGEESTPTRLPCWGGINAIGGLGAWLLGPALASVVYGVSLSDPLAWLAMAGIVSFTTLAASWRPSRQASRVDPVQLLREE